MSNLSKAKREKMLDFLKQIKAEHTDDKSIKAITEIENHLLEKKYGLVWEEHSEHVDEMLNDYIPVFNEDKDRKIVTDENLPYNFILEGDNLQSLYLLEKTHKGRIDVIYIDPPYNTGNEDFVYNDKIVNKEDSYYHSKWLSFMCKRLKIAKNLLSKDGIIFISIDDNEQANLKLLCDEIFNEKNFVNTLVVKMSEASGIKMGHTNTKLPKLKEYVLIYKKDKINLNPISIPKEEWDSEYNTFLNNFSKEQKRRYDELCNKAKLYSNLTEKEIQELDSIFKNVQCENLSNVINKHNISNLKSWLYKNAYRIIRTAAADSVKKLADLKKKTNKNQFFVVTSKRNGLPYVVKSDYDTTAKKPRVQVLFAENYLKTNVCDLWTDIKTTGLEAEGGIEFKNGKKPLQLLNRLLSLASKNILVLDFFAGSGSIAESVLYLNEQDGGNRKFILCTNNEVKNNEKINFLIKKHIIDKKPKNKTKTEEEWIKKWNEIQEKEDYLSIIKSKEYQELGICKSITFPRVKTVITGIRKDGSKYSDGLSANLKYFKCDWVKRKPEDYLLSNALCLHIKEMIELQNAIEIDQVKNVLILNKDDLKKTILDKKIYKQVERIWVNQNIIFNSEEMTILNKKEFNYIPRGFFAQELKEVAE